MQSVRLKTSSLVVLLVILFALAPRVHAAVEWNIQKTLKIESTPLDIAVSSDGQTIFVLTEDGKILVYDHNGLLKENIAVGSHVDQITIGPRGEQLFAVSRKNKTVEIISVVFIRPINTMGAPFKGPAQAPVTIAVFSDFQ